MKRIGNDTLLVFVGLALILAFALGQVLGTKVTEGIQKTVAMEVRR